MWRIMYLPRLILFKPFHGDTIYCLSLSALPKYILWMVILWILSISISPNSQADWNLVDTLRGHTDAVNCITFSSDGRLLASGSKDKTVIIWNALTGRREETLTGHNGEIYSVAFNSDGQMLASASEDGTVILWNPETGEKLRTIAHNGVHSIAFSPDGQLLASGSWRGTIRLWNPKTGQQIEEVPAHGERVYSVSFSPDSTLLASSSWDSTIKFWNLKQKKIVNTLSLRGGTYANFITFSPDSRLLASTLQNGTIKLWDPEIGKMIGDIAVKESPVVSVAFSSDGQLLASDAQDNTIKIWNLNTQRKKTTLKGHQGNVNSVAFSSKDNLLASASSDGTVKLWQDINLSIKIFTPWQIEITDSQIQGRNAIFRLSVNPLIVSDKLRYYWRLDEGQWTETRETSVKLPDLPNGYHLFEIKGIDMDGNEVIVAKVFYVDDEAQPPINEKPPEIEITSVSQDADNPRNFTTHFTVSSLHPPFEYSWYLDDEKKGSKTEYGSSKKEIVSLKGLSNGQHVFEVKAIDSKGKEKSKYETFMVGEQLPIDEKPPEIEITSVSQDADNPHNFIAHFTVSSLHPSFEYSWYLDDEKKGSKTEYGSSKKEIVSLKGLSNGQHVFEVKAIDSKGKEKSKYETFMVGEQLPIDEKPPEIEITSVSQDADNPHNFIAHFTVSSLHPPFEYSWYLDDEKKGSKTEYGSSKEEKVLLEGLASGQHVFEVKAIDSKGKEKSKYETFMVGEQLPIDEKPPEIEIISVSQNMDNLHNFTAHFVVSGSHPLLRYSWYLDGKEKGSEIEPGSSKEARVILENPVNGRHVFEVKVIDNENKENTAYKTFTVDEQAPNTEIVNPPEEPIETEDITIKFRGSDLQTEADKLRYSWRLDGSIWTQPERKTIAPLKNLSKGRHLFEVKTIDADEEYDKTPAKVLLFVSEINPELPDTKILETRINKVRRGLFKESNIIVKFTGKDLQTPTEQLQYSWSFDEGKWSDFSIKTGISLYRKLNEGFYLFEVKTKDTDGKIDPTPDASIIWFESIPFYESPTDILIVVSLLIGFSSGIYLFYFFIILPYWRARNKFNPYIIDKPIINPEMVFGRDKLLKQITAILPKNSIVLCGKEKIGKTTLLRQLEHRLEKPFIPIYVDVSEIPEYEFFSKLMQNIDVGCREYLPVQRNENSGNQLLSWYTFGIELYNEIIKQLKSKHGEDMKLVLLLDNINHFYRYDQEVHYYLRDFLMRFADNLRMVCATDEIVTERWGKLVSPWYDFSYLINVQPLAEKYAIQLIESPVRFTFGPVYSSIYSYSKEAKNYILEQSNCEPFSIQTLCKGGIERISNVHRREVTPADLENIRTDKSEDSYDETRGDEQSKEGIPYTLNPVYGENFYGREELIQNILNSENRRALIIGGHKMGKTPLLQQLECKLKSSHIVFYLSLKGIEKSEDFETYFIMVCKLNEQIVFDVTFNDDIQTTLRVINNKLQERGKYLFLLVDDAENLAELGSSFLDKLRISLEEANRINFVLAGSQKIYKIREVSADWFESFPNPWILGPLANQEANDLITQGEKIKVSGKKTIKDIQKQTSNHPYFIQLLCSTLFESPGRLMPVSEAEIEKVYNKANQLGIIEQLYHFLSPLQQDIVIRIFENESIAVDKEKLRKEIDDSIGDCYNIDNEAFEGALKNLREFGYIDEDYRISNDFLREWLKDEDRNDLRGVGLLRKISMDFGYLSKAEQTYAYQKTKSATKAEYANAKKAAIETMGAIMFYLSPNLKEEALKSTFWYILSDESKEPPEFREAAAKVLIFLMPHLSREQRREERQIRFLDDSIAVLDKPSLRRIREVDDFLKQYRHMSGFSEYIRDW